VSELTESAKQIALAHAITFGGTEEQITSRARSFENYLLGDTGVRKVFVMTSQTYGFRHGGEEINADLPDRHVIAVFQKKESAIVWRDDAGVTDGIIEEWGVE
jgi:hypothetical protein